ncbi:hypothetical protein [uncultured Granulicatella sp.]|uniref:hypothetical protein n=1 Tax=uncultured Granulicatella sp. TaxID=316089 RepID=UPI0028D53B42|nr:hypothetical protein [uncultured Granulicatella sp.]
MSKELNELIKELGKIVDGNQSIVDEWDKLKSLYEKLKAETAEEFEYPFEEDEPYWAVKDEGYVQWLKWDNECYDKPRYEQGHIFKTEQEAKRECDRRALLTRFRQFRDKCNGDWKPNWGAMQEEKYYILIHSITGRCNVEFALLENAMSQFGYFKNVNDCLRAIQLFEEDIIRLWVDE